MNSYDLLLNSGFRYRKHLAAILEELEFKADDSVPGEEMIFGKEYGTDADVIIKVNNEGILNVIVPEYTIQDGTFLLNYLIQKENFEALKNKNEEAGMNTRIIQRNNFPKDFYNISREIGYSVEVIALADAAVSQAALLKERTGPRTKMTEEKAIPFYENMKNQFECFMSEQH